MSERAVIPPSAPDSDTPNSALHAREPFVAPRVDDIGDLTTLTLLGGSVP
jgi:hypothetical protein